MNVLTQPPEWNSPYYPVEFLFDFYKKTFLTVGSDGGKAVLVFGGSALYTKFIEGENVYIESGVYEGEWEIVTVTNQFLIKISADYISTDSAVLRNLIVPTFRVYKGYYVIEAYPTELPLTEIAEFIPDYNPDYQVLINISGYLQSIFRILPPTDGIDFNMFNQFRISYQYDLDKINAGFNNEYFLDPKKVVNSAIKTNILMAYYLNGIPLTANQPGIVFSCSKTIISRLSDSFVNNQVLEGLPNQGDYNNDYNDDYLN